jgi:hypothetical protein
MRLSILLLVGALLSLAAEKRIITNEAGNDNVDITANPLIDREQIKAVLGDDLPEGIVAVQIKFAPKGDAPVSVSRDDFILLSHRDGQRSGPYAPSQIAGSSAMVVKTQDQDGNARSGPSFGGIPGIGGRRPRSEKPRAPGAAPADKAPETVKTGKDDKENPLLKKLEVHMLPDKETTEPVSGLLYFPLEGKEGKTKTKDLELIYQGPAGRLFINFR